MPGAGAICEEFVPAIVGGPGCKGGGIINGVETVIGGIPGIFSGVVIVWEVGGADTADPVISDGCDPEIGKEGGGACWADGGKLCPGDSSKPGAFAGGVNKLAAGFTAACCCPPVGDIDCATCAVDSADSGFIPKAVENVFLGLSSDASLFAIRSRTKL